MIKLEKIVGTWESVNLNPTVMIYRSYGGAYHLIIIELNEHTRQAHTSEYEIEQDLECYIHTYSGRKALTYNSLSDTVTISTMGEYMRN